MAWNTEKDFGKFVIDKLKKEGLHTMRIESASTITGCPDMYVQGAGDDYFIELKNIKTNISDSVKVPWRPGQQAWAVQYALSHTSSMDTYSYKVKHSWTFLASSNKVLLIRMDAYHSGDVIYTYMPCVYEYTIDEFKSMSLKTFLQMYTYSVTINMKRYLSRRPSKAVLYVELIAYYVQMYTYILAGTYDIDEIDAAFPEIDNEDMLIKEDTPVNIPHNAIIENLYNSIVSYRMNEQKLEK